MRRNQNTWRNAMAGNKEACSKITVYSDFDGVLLRHASLPAVGLAWQPSGPAPLVAVFLLVFFFAGAGLKMLWWA